MEKVKTELQSPAKRVCLNEALLQPKLEGETTPVKPAGTAAAVSPFPAATAPAASPYGCNSPREIATLLESTAGQNAVAEDPYSEPFENCDFAELAGNTSGAGHQAIGG